MSQYIEHAYSEYDITSHKGDDRAFVVRAIGPDAEPWFALFEGPNAKERAEEYARFKNAQRVA